MIVLGPVGSVVTATSLLGVVLVTCSGEAGELAGGVEMTVYETGISEMTVLPAGQSVTSAPQEVMVMEEVE
jgi:hypothetical protein